MLGVLKPFPGTPTWSSLHFAGFHACLSPFAPPSLSRREAKSAESGHFFTFLPMDFGNFDWHC
jgi:hypothetical protein